MLFISHLSSQNIVSWYSLECKRGRKTINYFWLTSSICVCVCVCRGGGCCAFLFNRASGLNWVNRHLAIWSDSPALCGSSYGSKISAVRLFCVSSRFIRSFDTSPGRDQCPLCERKHQKEHCATQSGKGTERSPVTKELKLASDKDLWRLYLTIILAGHRGPSHCNYCHGFMLWFENHRCPLRFVTFCFSLNLPIFCCLFWV